MKIFKIKRNAACEGEMAEYTLELSSIALNPTYNVLWRFWFRNIVTILLPFFLLAFFNGQIVTVLQRNQQKVETGELCSYQTKVQFTIIFELNEFILNWKFNIFIFYGGCIS